MTSTNTERNTALRQARAHVQALVDGRIPQQFPLRDHAAFKDYVKTHAGDDARTKAKAMKRLAILADARKRKDKRKAVLRMEKLSHSIANAQSISSNPQTEPETREGVVKMIETQTDQFNVLLRDFIASYGELPGVVLPTPPVVEQQQLAEAA